MQQIQDYYAAYAHCEQASQYYAERYERPVPVQQEPEVDYDDEE
jgi:hypothetical protein